MNHCYYYMDNLEIMISEGKFKEIDMRYNFVDIIYRIYHLIDSIKIL